VRLAFEQPARTTPHPAPPIDERFSRLMSAVDWARLPAPIRRRFSRNLGPHETALYAGAVASTQLTLAGRLVGQLARLVGAPLPLAPSDRVAATVVVTEDAGLAGQLWTRLYARPGRRPQVIHSTKRFAGPTGLEECVGGGVGMRLKVAVERRALVFRSVGFFVRLGRWTVSLPAWLTPGVVQVIHREERHGSFSFTLTVTHPWCGELVRQIAFFHEVFHDHPSHRAYQRHSQHPRLRHACRATTRCSDPRLP
jgi:uncharacterized protein DUF4166